MSQIILPHGGALVELMLAPSEVVVWRKKMKLSGIWSLTSRQLCDMEMIMNGAFSPLNGFMNRADHDGVVNRMRLKDGTFWPIPITLDVHEAFAEKVSIGDTIGLADRDGALLAALEINDLWQPELNHKVSENSQLENVFHDESVRLGSSSNTKNIGGRIFGFELPQHFDFQQYRPSPLDLRSQLQRLGWSRVVAIQPGCEISGLDLEIIRRTAKSINANPVLCPHVGEVQDDDLDHYKRMRRFAHYQQKHGMLISMIPMATRRAGPRAALLNAIVYRNYGCSHFLIGEMHSRSSGDGMLLNAVQDAIAQHEDELGIRAISSAVSDEAPNLNASRAELEHHDVMSNNSDAAWSQGIVASMANSPRLHDQELPKASRNSTFNRNNNGLTIFFTGLSGAGKSTIAKALVASILELSDRQVTLLDGDIVRQHLSSELGFSRAHRDLNILRMGFVASEISKHSGIAICAPIAPYAQTRQRVRRMVEEQGAFIEVYVSTSLDVCESRDRKGLYARARAGMIKEFTGVTDPYEIPQNPEVQIDSTMCSPFEAVATILRALNSRGLFENYESSPSGVPEFKRDQPILCQRV